MLGISFFPLGARDLSGTGNGKGGLRLTLFLESSRFLLHWNARTASIAAVEPLPTDQCAAGFPSERLAEAPPTLASPGLG